MIDSQATNLALFQPIEDQLVSGLKNLGILSTNRHKVAHVEEAPVVDPLTRNFPVRELVRLTGDQLVEQIEAGRIAGRAVLQVGLSYTRTDVVSPAPSRRAFALPNVMTAVRSGMFEGWTT